MAGRQRLTSPEHYKRRMNDPRWYACRDEVLERDHNTCQECGARGYYDRQIRQYVGTRIIVHHMGYLWNHAPWLMHQTLMVALCDNCHELALIYENYSKFKCLTAVEMVGLTHAEIEYLREKAEADGYEIPGLYPKKFYPWPAGRGPDPELNGGSDHAPVESGNPAPDYDPGDDLPF